jgi:AraC-like DNA-binding protein
MLGANPHLLAQVEQPILEYLAQQGAPLPLSALRARLVERLCEPLTQEVFAESLGVAASNLQESLEHQHVNFAQLLDQAREAQTLNLLAMPNLTLEQVSARVGFSNTSSLIRAFRRWQGMTPLKYRKQRLAPGP